MPDESDLKFSLIETQSGNYYGYYSNQSIKVCNVTHPYFDQNCLSISGDHSLTSILTLTYNGYGLYGKKGSLMKLYVYICLTVMQPILTNSIVTFKSHVFLYRSTSTMDVPFLMLWLFQRLLNIKANTHTSYSTGCFYKRFHRWSLEPLSLTVMTTQMSMVNEIWLISLDDSLSLKVEYAFETMCAKSIWKT